MKKMKKLKKLSLENEIKKEAEQIEKKVREDRSLDDIKVSDEMEKELFNKIQDYEYDKRYKKVIRKKKKSKLVIGALAAVLILGSLSYGAKLAITIHGVTFQPSELVKILFVFFAAGMLHKQPDFRRVVVTTAAAAAFCCL